MFYTKNVPQSVLIRGGAVISNTVYKIPNL